MKATLRVYAMHTVRDKSKSYFGSQSRATGWLWRQLCGSRTVICSRRSLAGCRLRIWTQSQDLQIFDLIGECITQNLNRVEWSSAQLAELASKAIAATETSRPSQRSCVASHTSFFGKYPYSRSAPYR